MSSPPLNYRSSHIGGGRLLIGSRMVCSAYHHLLGSLQSASRVLLRPSWTSKILLQDVFLAHLWTGLNGDVASHVNVLSEGIVQHAPRRCQMSQTLIRVNIVKVPTASTLFRKPQNMNDWSDRTDLSCPQPMFEAMAIDSFLAQQELFTYKSSARQPLDFTEPTP